jgi:hypothetical protein
MRLGLRIVAFAAVRSTNRIMQLGLKYLRLASTCFQCPLRMRTTDWGLR